MDRQRLNRITGIFLTVTVAVIVLMLAGTFRRTSHITLPDTSSLPGPPASSAGSALTVVEIAPDTVQDAIGTLSRPEAYRRTVTVEQSWEGGSGSYQTQVSVSGGWTRLDRELAGDRVRHTLTDGETSHIWYDNETAVYTAPAAGITADDEQTIPSYEDILALETDQIASADYRAISGVDCIYVETAEDPGGYVLRYWVGVDSGLLVAAERLLQGRTVYRMAALELDPAGPGPEDFLLPDGTPAGAEGP